ncbi:hypothetical protein ACOMHN_032507 [Nucella lapillus]
MNAEHEMTSGVIPLRHASLPGHVKLPRRYEKAAMGSSGIPVRLRKISIQPGHSVLGDSLSDRLTDLTAAILWIKQELIMLRQHDILLKRQFFDIHHSIQTLQKPKQPPPSSTTTKTSSSSHPTSSIDTTSSTANTTTRTHKSNSTSSSSESLVNGDVVTDEERSQRVRGRVENVFEESDFVLETFVVRPSSSVTLLNEDSEDDEGGEGMDSFCEDLFFRPRTSSMRTSRDMAALARRRGSKELI